jgi:hypothetical protein
MDYNDEHGENTEDDAYDKKTIMIMTMITTMTAITVPMTAMMTTMVRI